MCKSCKKNKLSVTNLAIKYGKCLKVDVYIYYFLDAWRFSELDTIPEDAKFVELIYKNE